MASQNERSFFGWVTLILAPLGIFGGPLAIASMMSHLIKWQGPFGYAIHFWKEEIHEPFRNILEWIAHWIHIPKPPSLIIDYVVLSLLATSSYLRATYLVPKNSVWPSLKNAALYLFFWPIQTLSVFLSVMREGVKSWPRLLLTFAPFLGFFLLWLSNALFNKAA